MNHKVVKFLIFFTISYQLSAISCFSGTLDKVIVVVNEETITQGELDAASASIIEQLKTKFKGEELAKEAAIAKREVLSRMVEDKLVLSAAKKIGVEATASDIERKLSEVKSNFDSEEKFNEALQEEGVALNDLKQRYADQVMVSKLLEMEVRKKIIINPTESFEYYKLHKEEFMEPERVRLKNILIKPEGELKDEDTRLLAEKILGFLKAGENFDELALKYSKGPNPDIGGDLGFVKRGQMLKEIENTVFDLKAGQISEVIRTQLGYHIFKVTDKNAERIKEFNEVKDEIEKHLFFEKGKKRYKEWIEELKKNAYISFR